MKILYFYPLIFFLHGCDTLISSPSKKIVNFDTISYDHKLIDSNCIKLSKGFYQKYGLFFSNFFEELLPQYDIDIDKDGRNDTIAVFAPKNMVLPSVNIECAGENKASRFLLVKIRNLYYKYLNVINNKHGIATTGIPSFQETSDGFVIIEYYGNACFTEAKIFIVPMKGNLNISKIEIRKGCPGSQEDIKLLKYTRNENSLNMLNRRLLDSLLFK